MLPVFYSFRRCPYAMRARMALQYSGVKVELREVLLKDKPASLLAIDSEATVPLLVLPSAEVIDESWQIMLWAIRQNDQDRWLGENETLLPDIEMLLEMNDYSFKTDLDHYKYADRYPEYPAEYYRSLAEEFLQGLEESLCESQYLLGGNITAADIAIFPFIRQFASVDKPWFDRAPYPKLQQWLQALMDTDLFDSIMYKLPVWQESDQPLTFPVSENVKAAVD
ncbi:MAG: glutathione S-transferase [Pseudomonadota bacterium]|nr:glutathione S-transferase [Pseudomonadota bacterium]